MDERNRQPDEREDDHARSSNGKQNFARYMIGGLCLIAGNAFGRFIGILGAGLGAINALLSIGGSYPWWSLGVFFLCIYVIHGLFIFGDDQAAQGV